MNKYIVNGREVEGVLSLTPSFRFKVTGKDEEGNEHITTCRNKPILKNGEEYEDKRYRIEQLLSEFKLSQGIAPCSLNYKIDAIKKLHQATPFSYFDKGRLVKAEYFMPDLETGEVTDKLALEVNIKYVEQDGNFPLMRTTTRRWVDMDGKLGEIEGHDLTTSVKYYSPEKAELEGIKRRTNIVNNLMSKAKLLGVDSYFKTLFGNLGGEITAFKESGNDKIITKIEDYQGAWLEKNVQGESYTIREAIITGLTI